MCPPTLSFYRADTEFANPIRPRDIFRKNDAAPLASEAKYGNVPFFPTTAKRGGKITAVELVGRQSGDCEIHRIALAFVAVYGAC